MMEHADCIDDTNQVMLFAYNFHENSWLREVQLVDLFDSEVVRSIRWEQWRCQMKVAFYFIFHQTPNNICLLKLHKLINVNFFLVES